MTREELNKGIQEELFQEEQKDKRKRWIKKIIKLLICLIIFLSSFYTYTTYISTVKIGVREYRIINEKIPESYNGLKIIQFSDLHFGSTMFNENMKKIVNICNKRKPDLVLFTGDLIDNNYKLEKEEQEKLIIELKKINSTLGKYAILGDEDTEKTSTIFNQSEFTILRNEYDLIYKDNTNPILLIGILAQNKNPNIENAYSYFTKQDHNSNIFTITMLHEPDTVEDILNNYQTDLFLAGHSHNGNIRVPFTKYSLFKVNGAKKYDQDHYKLNNSDLYISSGLGTKKGIRLFCRPSINFFRLSNK